MRIFQDLDYEIWYTPQNKTIYIYPPIKTIHLIEIKKILKYYALDIENIIVGKIGDTY